MYIFVQYFNMKKKILWEKPFPYALLIVAFPLCENIPCCKFYELYLETRFPPTINKLHLSL